MKQVLILGAGLVTGPIVSYLLDKGYHVTVASRTTRRLWSQPCSRTRL